MLESLFNKVAGLKGCNFIKKRLQHRCSPILQNFKNTYFKEHLRTPAFDNCEDASTFASYMLHLLTHFTPIFQFYTPWKRQKARGFLILSGGMEVEPRHNFFRITSTYICHISDFSMPEIFFFVISTKTTIIDNDQVEIIDENFNFR